MKPVRSHLASAWRAGLLPLLPLLALALPAAPARADSLEDNFNTLWEVLWDQRGTPRQASRWEGSINYRVSGLDLAENRGRAAEALREAAAATGLSINDVTDSPGQPAQLELITVPDDDPSVPANSACVAFSTNRPNWALDKATIRMRRKQAWYCVRHEVMHAMGLRGHPSGLTILGYLSGRRDRYLELDLLMLRTWYSGAMTLGATPLEAMVVLGNAAAGEPSQGLSTEEARRRVAAFMANCVEQLKALATGKGGVPAIVLRSGRASEAQMRNAARESAYFLGLAYLRGTGVDKDDGQAGVWLKAGAEAGHPPSQVMWGRALASGRGVPADPVAAYTWFATATRAGNSVGKPDMERLERTLSPAQLEQARAAAATAHVSPATP